MNYLSLSIISIISIILVGTLFLITATVKILREYERAVVFTLGRFEKVRAIAKQAEAERDRRAKIIHAEAEFQASQTLVNAAKILSSIPAAMQLRYLQTLTEIGAEQNSTIIFPMPIDIIKPFLGLMERIGKPAGVNGDARLPHTKDVPLAE